MMLFTSCKPRKCYSDYASELRHRKSSIDHTRARREILETPVINWGPISVACKEHPKVRVVAKEKIIRSAANVETESHTIQMNVTQMNLRRSAPKTSARNKIMMP